jgi:hypothetical protein
MAKHHGGTDHIQGTLQRGGPGARRVYANHGGTSLQQGKVHEGVPPRVYANHGGTSLPMGTLSGKKRKQ